jgi:hypothetical protein
MASFDKTELRTAAAVALAETGDRESAPAIGAWVQQLESRTLGFQYRSALYALARVDPSEAEKYAIAMLLRVADGKLGPRVNADLLRAVEFLSVGARDKALPVLRTLGEPDAAASFGSSKAACVLTAMRLRMNDGDILPLAREQVANSLTNNLAVNCYSEWMPEVVGDNPDDVDTLILRHGYEPMLRFVQHVRLARNKGASHGFASSDWQRGAARLLAALHKMLALPELGDRSRNDYFPSRRARHLGTMAGLGDATARDLLYKMIEDSSDDSVGPWIAAWYALRLGLADAAPHVLRRFEMGIERATNLENFESTVGVLATWRTRVLDELVTVLASDDARWAIAMLDREAPTRERALMLLARRKPAGACQVVLSAAPRTDDSTIKQAMWGLSILGDMCRQPMVRAARDARLKPDVRGPAIVLLAMIRAPEARSAVDAVRGHPDFRLYEHTANIILRSPE